MTILSPWYLTLLIPALGALVFVYRKSRGEQKVRLGTLMFLEKLQEKVVFRRKLYLPLRFFVELLLLTVLIGALSGITVFHEQETIAIVIDPSESMGHVEYADESRFQRCLQALEERLAIEREDANYRLFVTAPFPQELTSDAISKSALVERLQSLSLVAAEGDFSVLGHLLSKLSELQKVIIASDLNVRFGGGSPEVQYESLNCRNDDESASNVAISAIEYRSEENEIVATVEMFSADPSQEHFIDATLSEVTLGSRVRAGKWQTVDRFSRSLSSRTSETIRLKNVSSDKVYYLNIRIAGKNDSLAADNDAWVLTVPQNRESVSVYSPYSVEILGLPPLPQFNFRTPQDSAPEEGKERKLFQISHKQQVSEFLHSGLYVLPVAGDAQREGIQTAGEVVRVADEHPLLDYLDVSALSFREVLPLNVPEWAAPIIEVEAGVIAFAGVVDNRPIVAFGFEIFPLEQEETPVSSIFFLNAMKWLESSAFQGSSALDSRWPEGYAGDELILVSERGAEGERFTSGILPPRRGVLFALNGDPVRAQNFFSVSESDPQMRLPLMPFVDVMKDQSEFTEGGAELRDRQEEGLSTRRMLILFVLFLLALDSVLVVTLKKYTVRDL